MNATTPHIRPDILTNSGIYFNLLEPEKNEYRIRDIAHALSHICRFTGHTREFYSVAQHCVLASREMEKCTKVWAKSGEPALHPSKLAMAALLHDSAEAYLGDVASPLKQLLPEYKAIEHRVEVALFYSFGLQLPMPPSVKQIDIAMLATERRDLMPPHSGEWTILEGSEPLPEIINPWGPGKACREFLKRWEELGGAL